MKKMIMGLGLVVVLALFCGCSSTGNGKMSPAVVRIGVSTSVGYALAKHPEATPYVKAVSPIVCSAATGEKLSPSDVVALIQASNADILKTPEGILIVNGALLLYTSVWENYGNAATNNIPEVRPFLQATCDGIKDGLGMITVTNRSLLQQSVDNPHWPKVK